MSFLFTKFTTMFFLSTASSFVNRTCSKDRGLICFSVKANSNTNILKLISDQSAGFDVVSGGELAKVLYVGAQPDKIIFSGVGKSNEELVMAIQNEI